MDVTPLIKDNAKVIQSYAGGSFRVSGQVYDSAIIVMPESVLPWQIQNPADVKELSEDDFKPLLDIKDQTDVVLLGTGEIQKFLEPALRKSLRESGLHVETMDTGAACRTYNVLMAEGRRVVAALLAYNTKG